MPLNPSWIHTVLTVTSVLATLISVVERTIAVRHLDADQHSLSHRMVWFIQCRSQPQTVDPDVNLEHRSLFSLGGQCVLILSAEHRFLFLSFFLSPPSSAKKLWLNVGEQNPKVIVCNVLFCFDGSFRSLFRMKPSQDENRSLYILRIFFKTTVCRWGSAHHSGSSVC